MAMNEEELFHSLALHLMPHVGPVMARNLLSYYGSATELFRVKSESRHKRVPGVGKEIARILATCKPFERAEQEMNFLMKHADIQVLRIDMPTYPFRLRNNADAPFLLFYKGTANLNAQRMIAVVGTRRSSEYGDEFSRQLIHDLKPYECVVVSGLAYGIDIITHRACLKEEIPTVGVVAHGLDRIYPRQHSETARLMAAQGGMLSEFFSQTLPDRENFPTRNRIVAGLCDATIVVETATKGGAMITAELAHSYQRDVFAVPGRVGDPYSSGCHDLIRKNKAALLESAADLVQYMGWEWKPRERPSAQTSLPFDLPPSEQALMGLFEQQDRWGIDEMAWRVGLTPSEINIALMDLEMRDLVKVLPGRKYEKKGS